MVPLSSIMTFAHSDLRVDMSNSSALRFPSVPLETEGRRNTPTIAAIPPQANETDDATLIVKQGHGDREASSYLFGRYARSIRNVGRQILHDDSESDDLVQEVFLYIYKKWDLFDATKGTARSWIFQIAYTQAFIRRRQLTSIGFYASGIPDIVPESVQATNPVSLYDRTVEALFGRNGWKQVLESLTHEQRETLRLHFFEGYTFAEIAEQLGQSYANVRHHHYRGLEKLRKHLANDELSRR
jgi:RNA polymerase sigma-70 factor, ECF subfamily